MSQSQHSVFDPELARDDDNIQRIRKEVQEAINSRQDLIRAAKERIAHWERQLEQLKQMEPGSESPPVVERG